MHKPIGFMAVDVGGTKTLSAVFSPDGKVVYEEKIATSQNYQQFLKSLQPLFDKITDNYDLKGCCCAIPGQVDREQGIGLTFGNLPWKNVPIVRDFSRLLGGGSVLLENDAKLAGLSEAILKHNRYKKVLYITISTGIGDGVIINGKISEDFSHSESGHMMLAHDGRIKPWESIASGRALVERFGKKASEQNDPKVWRIFARDVALGLEHIIAVVQPEVVIIGGSVGAHFPKYGDFLKDELKKLENDMVKIPPVMQAERAEEAVIYGCYEYIKQQG